jgi:hypothetical protein
VVRNTQPMPLTSWPAGGRASLGSLPHLFSHFSEIIFKNQEGQSSWNQQY